MPKILSGAPASRTPRRPHQPPSRRGHLTSGGPQWRTRTSVVAKASAAAQNLGDADEPVGAMAQSDGAAGIATAARITPASMPWASEVWTLMSHGRHRRGDRVVRTGEAATVPTSSAVSTKAVHRVSEPSRPPRLSLPGDPGQPLRIRGYREAVLRAPSRKGRHVRTHRTGRTQHTTHNTQRTTRGRARRQVAMSRSWWSGDASRYSRTHGPSAKRARPTGLGTPSARARPGGGTAAAPSSS